MIAQAVKLTYQFPVLYLIKTAAETSISATAQPQTPAIVAVMDDVESSSVRVRGSSEVNMGLTPIK